MKFKDIICHLIGHRWVFLKPITRTCGSRSHPCTYLAGWEKRCSRCGHEETERYYPLCASSQRKEKLANEK